jgi:transcriptional regulator with XRE-family HTH domain
MCIRGKNQNTRTDIPALIRCHYCIIGSKPPINVITARLYPYCPVTLGDYLRKRRLDLNLTQKQLAEDILHTSTSNIRNWEANRYRVSLGFLPRVYDFIGFCPCDVSLGLGLRLKQRRENFGLSIRKISQILLTDPCTVAGWERGDHLPTKRNIQKIECFLRSYAHS